MNYFCFKPDGRYKSTPIITCYFLKRFSDFSDYDSSDEHFVPKWPNLCICIYNLILCRNGKFKCRNGKFVLLEVTSAEDICDPSRQ